MQGKPVLGMAVCSAEMPTAPVLGLGREMLCTTRACLHPQLRHWAQGRQRERGRTPNPAAPLCPVPEHPQTRSFGSTFGSKDQSQEQRSTGEGERERLAD